VRLEAALEPFASAERTLDVGGFGDPAYGRLFPRRLALDLHAGRGVGLVGSAYALPFSNQSFGNVLCLSVLEHLEEPKAALSEMRRVLRADGRILVSVPFLFPIHEAPRDYWRFTRYGLERLFATGWEIESLVAETSLQQTFAVLLQRVGYQTTLRANAVGKLAVFGTARLLDALPDLVRASFGDVMRRTPVPEAFASAYFLAARPRPPDR
jgi:SAM-dependent methyltransferase